MSEKSQKWESFLKSKANRTKNAYFFVQIKVKLFSESILTRIDC
jgi:hypothetical protein